ncbi:MULTISPECIES: carboxypeptidase-like regulatory domain-containing protein [unclassified Mameliella]|uniref:carboxypeptidase-like regulatory domain-containing protein n=1 Tax=unclassified Mameliella TaxID=2630630 RepID=UPI00273F8F4E|nr:MULTISPECIES: carboxypeptidase-like regulatory domain-containing protein [unclassified Mameliella]
MAIELEQAVLDGGRRFVNFFEGRILTGRDLRDEQGAARQGRTALGRAIGHGIVEGLEVRDVTPSGAGQVATVEVTAGLAVSRTGQTLDLAETRSVRLSVLDEDSPNRDAGAFDICLDQPPPSESSTAEGFHILTLTTASGYEEEAPKSGLEDGGIAAGCGRRYATLGLQFRLVRFDPALIAGDMGGTEIGNLALGSSDQQSSRLRNRVAHLGLGTAPRAPFPLDPFAETPSGASAWADWELETTLGQGSPPKLMSCEVPLAVLRLQGGQITFVDMWSVRRRPRTDARASDWPLIAANARHASDAATLYQFQEQLDWLFDGITVPASTAAVDYFDILPPVGFLPMPSASTFLPAAPPPVDLAPGRLIPLVEEAMRYPAVDLTASPAPGFVIYRVDPSADWLLFVSDIVPSPELEAIKCAELEDRIEELEDILNTPGTITGTVAIIYLFGTGPIEQVVPGAIVTATLTGSPAGSPADTFAATTDANGEYILTLPAGDYEFVVSFPGSAQNFASSMVTVERATPATVDFKRNIGNFMTMILNT